MLVSNKVPSKVPPLMRSSRLFRAFFQSAFIDFFLSPCSFSRLLVFLAFSPSAHSLTLSLYLYLSLARSPRLPFTAAKTDCLKDEREGRGHGREGWREGGDFNTIWPVPPG